MLVEGEKNMKKIAVIVLFFAALHQVQSVCMEPLFTDEEWAHYKKTFADKLRFEDMKLQRELLAALSNKESALLTLEKNILEKDSKEMEFEKDEY
jgi:hypothetical protein